MPGSPWEIPLALPGWGSMIQLFPARGMSLKLSPKLERDGPRECHFTACHSLTKWGDFSSVLYGTS